MVERSGVVLAGGEGSRMGAFKPLVAFRGRPLIAWVLDVLAKPLVDETLVAIGLGEHAVLLRDAVDPSVDSVLRFVTDEGGGPVAGLSAAARAAQGKMLLVAPCDSPFLTPGVYASLMGASGRDGAHVAGEPLVGVYRREAILATKRDEGSVWSLLASMDVCAVDDAALRLAARDIDTPEDLQSAESGLP